MKTPNTASSFFVLLLILCVTIYESDATLTCSDVVKNLRPCLGYLMYGSGKPTASCCTGASALASAASSSEDKKTACNCIQSTSKTIKMNSQLAQDLPKNCGITLPFAVSPNVDCSKIG